MKEQVDRSNNYGREILCGFSLKSEIYFLPQTAFCGKKQILLFNLKFKSDKHWLKIPYRAPPFSKFGSMFHMHNMVTKEKWNLVNSLKVLVQGGCKFITHLEFQLIQMRNIIASCSEMITPDEYHKHAMI